MSKKGPGGPGCQDQDLVKKKTYIVRPTLYLICSETFKDKQAMQCVLGQAGAVFSVSHLWETGTQGPRLLVTY